MNASDEQTFSGTLLKSFREQPSFSATFRNHPSIIHFTNPFPPSCNSTSIAMISNTMSLTTSLKTDHHFLLAFGPSALTNSKLPKRSSTKYSLAYVPPRATGPYHSTLLPSHMQGVGCGDFCRLNMTADDIYPFPNMQGFAAMFKGKHLDQDQHSPWLSSYPVYEAEIPKTNIVTPTWPLCVPLYDIRTQNHTTDILTTHGLCSPWSWLYLCPHGWPAYYKLFSRWANSPYSPHLQMPHSTWTSHPTRHHKIGCRELSFQGHHISAAGSKPLPECVHDVQNFLQPKKTSNLTRNLGLIHYYHRFIPENTEQIHLLCHVSTHHQKPSNFIIWIPEAVQVIQSSQNILAKVTLFTLRLHNSPTRLTTGASDLDVGRMLKQFQVGKWVALAFFSKSLQKVELIQCLRQRAAGCWQSTWPSALPLLPRR